NLKRCNSTDIEPSLTSEIVPPPPPRPEPRSTSSPPIPAEDESGAGRSAGDSPRCAVTRSFCASAFRACIPRATATRRCPSPPLIPMPPRKGTKRTHTVRARADACEVVDEQGAAGGVQAEGVQPAAPQFDQAAVMQMVQQAATQAAQAAIQQVTQEATRVAAQEAACVAAQEVARQLSAGQQIPPQQIPLQQTPPQQIPPQQIPPQQIPPQQIPPQQIPPQQIPPQQIPPQQIPPQQIPPQQIPPQQIPPQVPVQGVPGQQLPQGLQQPPLPPPPPLPVYRVYDERFYRLTTQMRNMDMEHFGGTVDATVAYDWKLGLQRKLEIIECPPEVSLRLAMQYLRGDALEDQGPVGGTVLCSLSSS
ncbi:hypothetical protein IGI04_019451, partial [Brassica rapa subsp. trilocularis]